MKFEEQVASYYSKLRRRSRFFSSLMLVSGISLAAAAPFLSYEVSQIECAEIGSVVTQDNSDEVQTLKTVLEGKDKAITILEEEVKAKNEALGNLTSNPDCESLVRVVEKERDRLEAELAEVTAGSTVKDETITGLERDLEVKNEEISKLASNPNCENLVQVVEKERDRLVAELTEVLKESKGMNETISRLKIMLSECKEQLEQANNSEPDCEKYTEEINGLKKVIITKDQTITRLRTALQETEKCPSTILSGTFHYNELFTFNGNQFMITYSSEGKVGAKNKFMHDEVDASSKVRTVNKKRIYTFMDSNQKNYQITFGEVVRTGIQYVLTSL